MSLHAIGVALAAYLISQGCPVPVVDGPEQPTTTWGRERIVIEHDAGGESFGNARGLHTNARHRRTRSAAYKLTIYAQSKAAGAKTFEHRTRVENILETVLVGLDFVAATNINKWEPKSGGLVSPPDLAASEQPNGAAYELKFSYDLPIRVVTFVGDAQPEGNIAGGLNSTTNVTRNADTIDAPNVACGV